MAVTFKKGVGQVDRATALASPTAHRFVPGAGYLRCPPLPRSQVGMGSVGRADPPVDAKDGSVHVLVSPGGPVLEFVWMVRHRAWARPGGWRMAFTADYLSRAGWVYKSTAVKESV